MAWPDQPLVRNLKHQTFPALVHAPGRLRESPWWRPIERRVLAARHRYSPCPELSLVTWNSGGFGAGFEGRGHRLGRFERSVELRGLPVSVLGGGIGSAWTNRMKLDLTIAFLERSAAELVLGADSADALLVGDPAAIVAAYCRQESAVLFNAEINPWPPELAEIAEFERRVAPAPFCHLNAGAWIGRRDAVLEAFRAARRWSERSPIRPRSDQACWKQVYRELHPMIGIDARCEAFQTLNGVRREIEVDGSASPRLAGLASLIRSVGRSR
jgi:hypothetical protein